MRQRYPAGPQSLLRAINERAVLELLGREGRLTRSEVARRTGLSKPTASAALASLAERGAVREVGLRTGRKGPAAALYEVDPDCAWAVGVDVGHDRIRVAVADVTGRTHVRVEDAVRRSRDALVRQVRMLCAKATAEAGIGWPRVTQVVVGLPAVVGTDGRRLSYGEGLPLEGEGLGDALHQALPAPVVLENDVNLAALAERAAGIGTRVSDFVLVSVGVGLGLGVIIDGRLHRGASGAAGEAGYLPGDRAGTAEASPGAPERDRVDSHIGAEHIVAEARRRGLVADPNGELTPRVVFERARAGDPAATAVVAETARSIAYVIACVTPLLDPSLVVLGGAIGANGDLLLDPVTRALATLSPLRPRVVGSTLGSDAALLGAVAMAVDLARETAFTAATAGPAEEPQAT